ncbi:terminase [Kosakonia cowanii]|uniref:terminase n=1 Tax=Kosakonia cowanii TaxID=208223 RepID=UPI0039825351
MAQWSTACTDWENRLIDGESIIPPPIFADQAEQALSIFRELRVSDLPGKPTFGECSEAWVFDFVKVIFGGYDAETGNQLVREYGLPITCERTRRKLTARCSSFWRNTSTSKSVSTCAATAGRASISGSSRRGG